MENNNENIQDQVQDKKKEKGKVPKWIYVLLSITVGFSIGVSAIAVDMHLEQIKKEEQLREIEQKNAPAEEEAIAVVSEANIQDSGQEAYFEEVETPQQEETRIFTVISTITNSYYYSDNTSSVAEMLSGGTQIAVNGEEDDYYIYTTKDGLDAYIDKEDVAEGVYYASYPNATDLRQILPDSEFDILFASDKNITGHGMYPAIPLLEHKTADMIKAAEEIFEADGYRIKIYDAYRPKWAQFELYDIVQDNKYIGNPYNGNSWHNLGRAVDMSLVSIETGEELEMPTPMHTFNSKANRYSDAEWSEAAKQNVDYMTKVMQSVGFDIIKTEWWHFENKGSGDTLPTELDYTAITYVIG